MLYQTPEPFQKRALSYMRFGWHLAMHRFTLNTASPPVYLYVYHLADCIKQLGAILHKMLRLVSLASAVVIPNIIIFLSHSLSITSFTFHEVSLLMLPICLSLGAANLGINSAKYLMKIGQKYVIIRLFNMNRIVLIGHKNGVSC